MLYYSTDSAGKLHTATMKTLAVIKK